MVGNKFQDVILKYSRAKVGEGKPEHFDASCALVNSLCGDEIVVFMCSRANGTVAVRYEAKGCSLCDASAAIMSESLEGRSTASASDLVSQFLEYFPKGVVMTNDGSGVEALFDMRRFPARERCVLLPWQAVHGCFV